MNRDELIVLAWTMSVSIVMICMRSCSRLSRVKLRKFPPNSIVTVSLRSYSSTVVKQVALFDGCPLSRTSTKGERTLADVEVRSLERN